MRLRRDGVPPVGRSREWGSGQSRRRRSEPPSPTAPFGHPVRACPRPFARRLRRRRSWFGGAPKGRGAASTCGSAAMGSPRSREAESGGATSRDGAAASRRRSPPLSVTPSARVRIRSLGGSGAGDRGSVAPQRDAARHRHAVPPRWGPLGRGRPRVGERPVATAPQRADDAHRPFRSPRPCVSASVRSVASAQAIAVRQRPIGARGTARPETTAPQRPDDAHPATLSEASRSLSGRSNPNNDRVTAAARNAGRRSFLSGSSCGVRHKGHRRSRLRP
ncbi:hypothetical protein SAMN05216489_04115 [Streptomyces sp. 3213]|nr:hypothetical protein SAMN05216489_04115 [Streptomyces sp. 3213] [Streptomyces sp. 3213.3]